MKRTATLLLVILLAAAPRAEALEHWFTYALDTYNEIHGTDFDSQRNAECRVCGKSIEKMAS